MKKRILSIAISIVSFSSAYAGGTDCSAGSNLDQYLCYEDTLNSLDQQMDRELKRSISNVKSEWGAEADKEVRLRIQSAQKSWLLYRTDQCNKNYYMHAPIHPPSQSLNVTLCAISKTKERIKEIKGDAE